MPVLLSIIMLLCDRTLIIESIPKLGHILSDTLSNEAKLPGADIKNIIFNLINSSLYDISTEKHKKIVKPLKFDLRKSGNNESTQSPSFGYDFNDTICKTVDDRVICGYDKNLGTVDNKIVDLGNGCRIRGDRLECGYLTRPFNNSRRPPVNDSENKPDIENNKHKLGNTSEKIVHNFTRSKPETSTPGPGVMRTSMTRKKNTINSTIHTNASSSIVKNVTTPTVLTKTGFTSRSSTLTTRHINITSGTEPAVTKTNKKHCVEKNDTIFCYDIKS